jgi:hypothetical protein
MRIASRPTHAQLLEQPFAEPAMKWHDVESNSDPEIIRRVGIAPRELPIFPKQIAIARSRATLFCPDSTRHAWLTYLADLEPRRCGWRVAQVSNELTAA